MLFITVAAAICSMCTYWSVKIFYACATNRQQVQSVMHRILPLFRRRNCVNMVMEVTEEELSGVEDDDDD